MELSDRIKALREGKRIKLIEMATALGVDTSNYAKIEKKGKKLPLERIEEIASALGVSMPELLGYDNEHTKGLESRYQALEQENAALKEKITAYQPVIWMIEQMMANPEAMASLALKGVDQGITRGDIEQALPDTTILFKKQNGTK